MRAKLFRCRCPLTVGIIQAITVNGNRRQKFGRIGVLLMKRRKPTLKNRVGTGHQRMDSSASACERSLLEFYASSGLLKFGFHLVCLIFTDGFFDRARRTINQFLRFLEAESGQGTNLLDDVDFLLAN